ncbi:MAG: DUF2203 family protein [Planctomycetes bacterium]|nr:DUF2203 family protein [Planctomycetota bacterium]
MKRKVYDAHHAEGLIPLLRSITNEIQEREAAIDRATAHLMAIEGAVDTAERTNLEAELAVHKRELRFARRELERLGCELDADYPMRVLIPSSGANRKASFAWSPADEKLQMN